MCVYFSTMWIDQNLLKHLAIFGYLSSFSSFVFPIINNNALKNLQTYGFPHILNNFLEWKYWSKGRDILWFLICITKLLFQRVVCVSSDTSSKVFIPVSLSLTQYPKVVDGGEGRRYSPSETSSRGGVIWEQDREQRRRRESKHGEWRETERNN